MATHDLLGRFQLSSGPDHPARPPPTETAEMPDLLRKFPFEASLLPDVQDFECGAEPWETPLATWIKADATIKEGALAEMRKQKGKLQVWLHVNSADELVGYSSLGRSKWEWPTKDDRSVPISLVPCVALQKRFWGQPRDDPPRYAAQLLDHLIFEAGQHPDRYPLLGLYVDPRNLRAIAAYKKAGFEEYFREYLEDGIEYRSLLLNLDREEPPAKGSSETPAS